MQRLLRHDGELATVIGSQVDSARRTLDELLARHLGDESPLRTLLGEEEGNAFIAADRHGDLERSLGERVASMVGEFSLDNKDSGLSRGPSPQPSPASGRGSKAA